VQLRWRLGTSAGFPGGGWFVDSISVSDPQCLPPVSNPVMINPALHGGSFSFGINTVTNRTYLIQYKTNLTDATWQTIESLAGNGLQQSVQVPVNSPANLFFRFQVQ
jgi:hypothetical protein